MPTGYTGGILDGSIKNFQEFGVICARAFGATIHMRDDSLDKPYEPRIPSTYHLEGIADAQKEIAKIEKLSDKQIIAKYRKELNDEIKIYQKYVVEKNENKAKLQAILAEVYLYVPPTPDHVGVKDFMKQQIEDTINWDADDSYYLKNIAKLRKDLKSTTDVAKIRELLLKTPLWNLDYHIKEHAAEVKRCEDSNKWVADYFKSLGL